eukprot:CAMPEP_0177642960 /NCGR_PEP_ID=MMETSP0447-20121125/7898_1 /TAXON_ID=0 /ORGANISM="Stygamoeba regulata, Strain BSH-02190019" /LENGTH=330 /DNA_ID=CAMNT_0019145219 /DNA_START=171 /DNA_END=1159 /DNA_ORIENTATION=+
MDRASSALAALLRTLPRGSSSDDESQREAGGVRVVFPHGHPVLITVTAHQLETALSEGGYTGAAMPHPPTLTDLSIQFFNECANIWSSLFETIIAGPPFAQHPPELIAVCCLLMGSALSLDALKLRASSFLRHLLSSLVQAPQPARFSSLILRLSSCRLDDVDLFTPNIASVLSVLSKSSLNFTLKSWAENLLHDHPQFRTPASSDVVRSPTSLPSSPSVARLLLGSRYECCFLPLPVMERQHLEKFYGAAPCVPSGAHNVFFYDLFSTLPGSLTAVVSMFFKKDDSSPTEPLPPLDLLLFEGGSDNPREGGHGAYSRSLFDALEQAGPA